MSFQEHHTIKWCWLCCAIIWKQLMLNEEGSKDSQSHYIFPLILVMTANKKINAVFLHRVCKQSYAISKKVCPLRKTLYTTHRQSCLPLCFACTQQCLFARPSSIVFLLLVHHEICTFPIWWALGSRLW